MTKIDVLRLRQEAAGLREEARQKRRLFPLDTPANAKPAERAFFRQMREEAAAADGRAEQLETRADELEAELLAQSQPRSHAWLLVLAAVIAAIVIALFFI